MQLKSAEQALAATALDGSPIEGKHHLVVKISDPSRKKAREGALYEGREVYVANVDWFASEAELKELFSKYGTVERVRIPRTLSGRSKGTAFVVFSTKVIY